jgi:alpha-N-arabinofuranosidase
VTWDADSATASVFLVNRSLTEVASVSIDLRGIAVESILESWCLSDADIYAQNTLAQPERVAPVALDGATVVDGILRVEIPAVGWAALRLGAF